ncbi:hypothetical protein QCM77_06970 [Bradyrhizobium sp. SSUT18]|uniref:hypothetical protein n=1 Tax=unclassified Bradyrhizobium TaxID=2631580 RepID=UPI00244786A0|nr:MULTISPECIES: hypothetical protein [unclassified Bradyrhizobium]MDH2350225.1 hypothetical protein [Bradyrhizobium sp. SSUT112]MDH2399687.1 hypothetical protein [Bradyrhizobium sp. SSUT18]
MPADLPVKAPPLAGPGQFRAWIEGGAIFSGGDPVSDTYGLTGQFDLTPKVGWESATGFDYRFAGSPWHISGQFRYGEGGKSTGLDSLTQTIVIGAASQTSTQTFANAYKETRWLADLAMGRDIAGSGPSTLQLKGGLRVTRLKMVEADAMTAPLRERLDAHLRQAFARLWREDAAICDWVTAERDSALAALQSVAAERHGFLAERDDARAQLAAVRSSTSWRLTAPLRRTKELFHRS